MGVLKPFSRSQKPLNIDHLPSGAFTVHRLGGIVGSTLPTHYPEAVLLDIAQTVVQAFAQAQAADLPLAELYIRYSGLTITAREMRGGALIFLNPATVHFTRQPIPPSMNYKNLEEFILHFENYIECWKQFNHYVTLARDRKFSRDDETHFLEIKSIIAQGLEAILASTDKAAGTPRKEEVNALMIEAPSLRYLSEVPEVIHSVEAQWHKTFLGLQSLLGQLKVQLNRAQPLEKQSAAGWNLFGKK